MTIGELSRASGVSIRALRHYDSIGLLKPAATSEAGYRQYDEAALQQLSFILLFRELKFSLKDIQDMLRNPNFDPVAALNEQIALLEDRRKHIDNLILLARGIKMRGLNHLTCSAFDVQELDKIAANVGDDWQDTPAMREFRQRDAHLTDEERQNVSQAFDDLLASFGEHPDDPACPEAQAMVQQQRDFITGHFYNCTPVMLSYLANLYDGGGEFTQHIDRLAGSGTASFMAAAMRIYSETHQS